MSDRIIVIRGETRFREVFERRDGKEVELGNLEGPIVSEGKWIPSRIVEGPGGTQDEALAWLLAPAEKAPGRLDYNLSFYGRAADYSNYTVHVNGNRLPGLIRFYVYGKFGMHRNEVQCDSFDTLEDAIRHLIKLNGGTPT